MPEFSFINHCRAVVGMRMQCTHGANIEHTHDAAVPCEAHKESKLEPAHAGDACTARVGSITRSLRITIRTL